MAFGPISTARFFPDVISKATVIQIVLIQIYRYAQIQENGVAVKYRKSCRGVDTSEDARDSDWDGEKVGSKITA